MSTAPGVTETVDVRRAPLPPLPSDAFLPPPPPSAVTLMDVTRAGTVTWIEPEPLGTHVYVEPAATEPVQVGAARVAGASTASTPRTSTLSASAVR